MQLVRSTLWRNALERDPHREARLLFQQTPSRRATEGFQNLDDPNARQSGAVDAGRNAVRDQTHATMEGGGADERLNAEVVESEIRGTMDHVTATHDLMKERESYAHAHMDSESYALWKEHEIFLALQQPKLNKALDASHALSSFTSGQTPPGELLSQLRSSLFTNAEIDAAVLRDTADAVEGTARRILAQRSQEVGGTLTWSTSNAETRQHIASEVMNLPQMQALLLTLQQSASMTEQTIKESNVEKVLEELGKKAKEAPEGHGSIFGLRSLGIEMHTIGDIIGGLSKTWEAITSAWQRRRSLHEARVARMFGAAAKVLPIIGTDVDQALQANLQSKEREEQDTYFNSLDQLKTDYRGVIKFMAANTNDYNRLQGAIKYAASRGWVYEYLRGEKPTALMGIPISKICANMTENDRNNYVSTVQQNNEKGARDESDGTKSRESQNNNLEKFENALRSELNDLNLWGAVGVMQAALGRGRSGETGTTMATIFMNELRRNAELRSLVTAEVLDTMFKWALPEVPFTLSRLQAERNKLAPWVDTGAKDSMMPQAGPLAATIGVIDRRLQPLHLTNEQRDQITGRILAGHTVQLSDGSYISIFDNNSAFNVYRREIAKNDYKLPDVKGADDYFSIANGRSEIVYAPESWVRSLVSIDSNGALAFETLSENLFVQFCNVDDELGAAGLRNAQRNFRNETREKISNGFISGPRKDLLAGLQTKYIYVGGEKIGIAHALRNRNLLTDEAIRLIWPQSGNVRPNRPQNRGEDAASPQLQQSA